MDSLVAERSRIVPYLVRELTLYDGYFFSHTNEYEHIIQCILRGLSRATGGRLQLPCDAGMLLWSFGLTLPSTLGVIHLTLGFGYMLPRDSCCAPDSQPIGPLSRTVGSPGHSYGEPMEVGVVVAHLVYCTQ